MLQLWAQPSSISQMDTAVVLLQDWGCTPGCACSSQVWETPAVLGVEQLQLLFSDMRKR